MTIAQGVITADAGRGESNPQGAEAQGILSPRTAQAPTVKQDDHGPLSPSSVSSYPPSPGATLWVRSDSGRSWTATEQQQFGNSRRVEILLLKRLAMALGVKPVAPDDLCDACGRLHTGPAVANASSSRTQ